MYYVYSVPALKYILHLALYVCIVLCMYTCIGVCMYGLFALDEYVTRLWATNNNHNKKKNILNKNVPNPTK